jgi:hypothetical protein
MQPSGPASTGDVHRFEINIGGAEISGLTSMEMIDKLKTLQRRSRLRGEQN